MHRKSILLFLMLLASQFAYAEDTRFFQVEVVVFENLEPASRQNETWPTASKLSLPATIVELGTNEQRFGFRSLSPKSYKLAKDVQALEDSGNYRVLHHSAWKQPGLDQHASLPVHIKALIPAAAETKKPTDSTVTPNPEPMPAMQLDGWVKIILARYLHADVSLEYKEAGAHAPSTPKSIPSSVPTGTVIETRLPPVYSLKQTRKMRSKEVHYIDSPILGMLVLITPLE